MHDSLVAYALSLEGLSYGETPDRYIAELYPNDTPRVAKQLASAQSSCGLVCEAILRGCGIEGRIQWRDKTLSGLTQPYASRYLSCSSIVYLGALARERKQWVSASKTKEDRLVVPLVGDMVLIGQGGLPAWGGTEHILTVTGRRGDAIESIDGGQVDERNKGRPTAIRRRLRQLLRLENGELWLVPPGTRRTREGRPLQGRRVQGWIKACDMPTCTGPSAA